MRSKLDENRDLFGLFEEFGLTECISVHLHIIKIKLRGEFYVAQY